MRMVRLFVIAVLLLSTAAAFGQPRTVRNPSSITTAAAKLTRFIIRTLGRLSPPIPGPADDDPGSGLAAPGTPAVTTP